jgi:hypothetical protein
MGIQPNQLIAMAFQELAEKPKDRALTFAGTAAGIDKIQSSKWNG